MADSNENLDFSENSGRSGYTDAYNEFLSKWRQGISFVDIMLGLREVYPEDIINTVLADARTQGYV